MGPSLRTTVFVLGILLCAVMAARQAAAVEVTIQLTGEVTEVQNGNPFGIAPSIGEPVTAWFIYDTTVAGQVVGQATRYLQTAPDSYLMVIDGITIAPDSNDWLVAIANETTFDSWYYEHNSNVAGSIAVDGVPEPDAEFQVWFGDSTATALSDESLLAVFPPLGAWTDAIGFLRDNGADHTIVFEITEVVQVPEPGFLAMLATGCVAIARMRRR